MNRKKAAIPWVFFLKGFTAVVLVSYLLALSGYFFSPVQWPAGGLFNPGFVYGWLVLFCCMVVWLFRNRVYFFFIFISLAAGIKPLSNSLSIHTGKDFSINKPNEALRIMQWNCEDLGGNLSWYTEKNIGRKKAEEFIKQYAPDLICMQDYSDFRGKIYRSNESFLRDTLGYPYRVFSPQINQVKSYGVITSGLNIVSKYAILAHGIYYYKNLSVPEAILWADIDFKGTRTRIVTTHFRSFYVFGSRIFSNGLPEYMQADSAIIMGNNIFEKLAYFQKQHTMQAMQLRAFLDTCSVPVILAADLNTIPSGNLYRLVKGNLKDGFMGNATGLGATYNYLLPHIRIDYLLHDPRIRLMQWHHFPDGFFDHDHLLGDYSPP